MKRPPGSAGVLLVERLQAAFQFDAREMVLLELAAAQADDVARLEALLLSEGMTVIGSMRQPKLSPVLAELRQQRLALAKLIGELQMPSEDFGEQMGRSPSSRRAQQAARARWSRVRREEEVRNGTSSA